MTYRRLLLTASLFFIPSIAAAHVALTDPVPRSGDNGLTMAPCGGVPAGAPTPFMAGETISVSWAVGQAHGGSLTIDLAPADDTGFRMYVLATDISDAEGMPTSVDVQLPDIDCDACTLRLSQLNPNPDNYYSCADISLSGASSGSSDSGSSGGSTGGSSGGSSDGGASEDGSADSSTAASAGEESSGGASATASGSATATTTSAAEESSTGTDTSAANDDSSSSGCGCTSDAPTNAWLWLPIAALALRRRR